jgi:exonuclease 3'-5' domain-containing protein 1
MKGIFDLQLLELAVRHSLNRPTKLLNGLGRSIENYVAPSRDWSRVKDEGIALFDPKRGGSYSVFEQRPLDPRILSYCAQDVSLIFMLEAALKRSFGPWGSNWLSRVTVASTRRVSEARSVVYAGKGRHRALAPMI